MPLCPVPRGLPRTSHILPACLFVATLAGLYLVLEASPASAAPTTITASFNVPQNGDVARPGRGTEVQLWDANLAGGPPNLLGSVSMGADGTVTIFADDDDPDDATCFDPYLVFDTTNMNIQVVDAAGAPYSVTATWTSNNVCSDFINFNEANAAGPGLPFNPPAGSEALKAWRVFLWAQEGWLYLRDTPGVLTDVGPVKVRLIPGHLGHYHPTRLGDTSTHPWDERNEIHIDPNDWWQWNDPATTLHELGHRVAQEFLWPGWAPPGAGSPHDFCTPGGLQVGIAWDEAFADFYAVVVEKERLPNGDTKFWEWDLETGAHACDENGDDTQYRVGALLWDLYDDAVDGAWDYYAFGFEAIWRSMQGCFQTSTLAFFDHTLGQEKDPGVAGNTNKCSWTKTASGADRYNRTAFIELARQNKVYRNSENDYEYFSRPPTATPTPTSTPTSSPNPTSTVPPLVAAFTFTPSEPRIGDPIQFTDTSTPAGAVQSRTWTFGDASYGTEANPRHAFERVGSYVVRLQIKDADGRPASTSRIVSVAPRDVSFSTSDDRPRTGQVVFFGDTSPDPGAITSRRWDFGDGTASTDTSPSHAFKDVGERWVSFTITRDDGATNSFARLLIVRPPPPVAAFTWDPAAVTTSDTIRFVDASTGDVATWAWAFGDGGSSQFQQPLHRFTQPGPVLVRLEVSDGAGTASQTERMINVERGLTNPPAAAFTWAPHYAPGEILFSDQSTDLDGSVLDWRWDLGDETVRHAHVPASGNDLRFAHTYAAPGNYTVFLTVVDDLGASTTVVRTITVPGARPVADFTWDPIDADSDRPIRFLDASTDPDGQIRRWHWDFGGGQTAAGPHVTYEFPEPGAFTVRLTVTDDDGFSETAVRLLLVRDRPGTRVSPSVEDRGTPGPDFAVLLLTALAVGLLRRSWR